MGVEVAGAWVAWGIGVEPFGMVGEFTPLSGVFGGEVSGEGLAVVHGGAGTGVEGVTVTVAVAGLVGSPSLAASELPPQATASAAVKVAIAKNRTRTGANLE